MIISTSSQQNALTISQNVIVEVAVTNLSRICAQSFQKSESNDFYLISRQSHVTGRTDLNHNQSASLIISPLRSTRFGFRPEPPEPGNDDDGDCVDGYGDGHLGNLSWEMMRMTMALMAMAMGNLSWVEEKPFLSRSVLIGRHRLGELLPENFQMYRLPNKKLASSTKLSQRRDYTPNGLSSNRLLTEWSPSCKSSDG